MLQPMLQPWQKFSSKFGHQEKAFGFSQADLAEAWLQRLPWWDSWMVVIEEEEEEQELEKREEGQE